MDQNKETVEPVFCPICGFRQITCYQINETKESTVKWFHCYCGTVFHNNPIDRDAFLDPKYVKERENERRMDLRMKYLLKIYLPIIEEMINGRKFLDVGFTLPILIQDMKERGWISTGIDLIPNDFITGDFEYFDFGDHKFDLIHLGHVLECFEDPEKALWICSQLLSKEGMMIVTTPAPELIHNVGMSKFGHWNSKTMKTFISEKELKRMTLGLGFDTILMRLNYSQRFVTWNDRHILLQKRY